MTAPVLDLSLIFRRDAADQSVLVADGFGLRLTVSGGHLVINDGLGRQRRERRLTRSQRTVSRIVILGHTGHVTLDAIRWCHDVGVKIVHADHDGRLLMIAGDTGRDDPRVRRAQAAAANAPAGLDIARALIGAKIEGQATVTIRRLGADRIADQLGDLAARARECETLLDLRSLEAMAANIYFGTWSGKVRCRIAQRDAHSAPSHWATFAVRRSPIAGNSPRAAADPINAMLNYSYTLAEAECRLALLALGLDPGIGVVHTDKKNRDSLALDLLEPVRPMVEEHVLDVLDRIALTRDHVHETRQGSCRLLPPLTHVLAEAIPAYAGAAGRMAERVSRTIAATSPGKVALTTPLSRINTANTQTPG